MLYSGKNNTAAIIPPHSATDESNTTIAINIARIIASTKAFSNTLKIFLLSTSLRIITIINIKPTKSPAIWMAINPPAPSANISITRVNPSSNKVGSPVSKNWENASFIASKPMPILLKNKSNPSNKAKYIKPTSINTYFRFLKKLLKHALNICALSLFMIISNTPLILSMDYVNYLL